MQAAFSSNDIELLKREIDALIPQVKSSHRVEAMARGLGWQTNAALRTTLRTDVDVRQIDDRSFTNYLRLHGFVETPFDALSEAVVRCKFSDEREAVQRVMEHEPILTQSGFGVHRDPKMTLQEHRNELAARRAALLAPRGIDEFVRAREYLLPVSHRHTINPKAFSYGLKHRAEHHHRDQGRLDNYVSNGALIAAAIHLGFQYRIDGPNAYFNMGSRGTQPVAHPTELGRYRRPPRPSANSTMRYLAWRNVLIAGINAGLSEGHFSLVSGDNWWDGERATYTFAFAGMPGLASVSDGGFGELIFHVALYPTPDAHRWIDSSNAGFDAGDVFATGWLERQRGKWLMTPSKPTGVFRKHLLPLLANSAIDPTGFLPEGRFIM